MLMGCPAPWGLLDPLRHRRALPSRDVGRSQVLWGTLPMGWVLAGGVLWGALPWLP